MISPALPSPAACPAAVLDSCSDCAGTGAGGSEEVAEALLGTARGLTFHVAAPGITWSLA